MEKINNVKWQKKHKMKLSKDQEEVWDRLKYGVPASTDWWQGATGVRPTNPSTGSIYIDDKTGITYIFDNTSWKRLTHINT